MKKVLLFIFLIAYQLVYSQYKTFKIQWGDYFKFDGDVLYLYENYHDSLKETFYKIYDDSVITAYDSKISKVLNDDGFFHSIKLSDIDVKFNLFKEFKNEAYIINNAYRKNCYFLKGDSILVSESEQNEDLFQQDLGEHKIFKFDFGKNRVIYWADRLGIIYKKNKELITNFSTLVDLDGSRIKNEYPLKPKESFNIKTNFINFGVYSIKRKTNAATNEESYYIIKNRTVLKSISLKYFNKISLIAYDNHTLNFYGLNLKLDSQFSFKTITIGVNGLDLLIKNKIKHISTKDYIITASRTIGGRGFYCGNVNYYTLKIGRDITKFVDGSRTDKLNYIQTITIRNPVQNDSMLFVDHKKEMKWTENGGFDDRILIYYKGKVGLYEIILNDTLMALKQILPIEYDEIYSLNDNVVLKKNSQMDFFDYFIKNKKMRFNKLSYENSSFFRYQKIDKKEGWIDTDGVLYDDE